MATLRPGYRAVANDEIAGLALLVDASGNALFPSAVAAADNLANPTAPQVLAHLMGFDGTTWDRMRVAGTLAALRTAPIADNTASDNGSAFVGMTADHAGNTNRLAGSVGMLYNELGGWNFPRGNTEITVLSSSARTATTNGSNQNSFNHRGALILINVTSNPGGGETLSLKAQVREPVASGYLDYADAGVVLTAANGLKGLLIYPGVTDADLGADIVAKNGPLAGRTWRPVVTHSASGSWTYSVSAVMML